MHPSNKAYGLYYCPLRLLKPTLQVISQRILLELREHRKALFKRKLSDVLSQILKNEEINVDMRNIKLSKHIQPLNWLTLSSLFINIYL